MKDKMRWQLSFLFVLLFISKVLLAQHTHIGESVFNSRFYEEEVATVHVVKPHVISDSDATVLFINNQKEFDDLQSNLKKAIQKNTNCIVVKFGRGPFYFKNEHVYLKDIYKTNLSLHFIGNNTQIISSGHSYRKGENYLSDFSTDNVYFDNSFNEISIWGKMYQADRLIDIINERNGLCRIHSSELKLSSVDISKSTYLQLTEWYMSGIYSIEKVEGQYIYFTASDLKPGAYTYGNYNVNYDYTVAKCFPRFRLCNVTSESSLLIESGKNVNTSFYECQSSSFLRIYGSKFKEIDISGIDFYGNAGGGSLFSLLGVSTTDGTCIHNCSFHGIKSAAVYLMNTSDTRIENCSFKDCYNDAILATHKVKNTTIINNHFESVGKGLKNSFAIHCQSAEYYIAGNTIIDFGYGGIGVGEGANTEYYGSGIVEKNVLFFSDIYAQEAKKCSLIDGGAIYLWPNHKRTIIRYNRIHNYIGANSNRGIYCDDGAFGFSVYGNVITAVYNSNYIDSRMTPVSKTIPTNTNNFIIYNIVSGRYKFEGRPGNNGCIKGQNIILSKESSPSYNIIINNINSFEEDHYLTYKSSRGLAIIVSRKARKDLKRLPFYSDIKQYFKTR